MTDHKELKIITFNTNGLSDFRKRKDVFDFLRKHKGNLFLLQETLAIECRKCCEITVGL